VLVLKVKIELFLIFTFVGDNLVYDLKVVTLDRIEKTHPRKIEYLHSLLINPVTRQLTDKAKSVFEQLFVRYAITPQLLFEKESQSHSKLDGIIGPEQWDRFQLHCTGNKMSGDLLNYVMENFETKTITITVQKGDKDLEQKEVKETTLKGYNKTHKPKKQPSTGQYFENEIVSHVADVVIFL
jgi:hypothetical protein